jgi:gliding motility-associated lipoprotein GldB
MRLLNLLLVFFSLSIVTSCENGNHHPDISNIQLNITIDRFERELFSADSLFTDKKNLSIHLSQKYGSFWEIYTMNIMRLGHPSDSSFPIILEYFLADASMKELYNDCMKKYPDLKSQETELGKAFKYYSFYFPEKPIPKVFSFISGFSLAIAAFDSGLGIGLDMYLGNDYEKYPFPEYQKKRMQTLNIVPDCIYGWVSTEFEFDSEKDDLLSHIIYQGKIMYAMDLLLPDMEDSLKIAYTENQLRWCVKNEAIIWAYFIENNLLYSTNKIEFYKKYLSEAPFTSGFPQDSPSKIGVWTGWQIVRSFMKNNPEISINELLDQKNAQLILQKSKYKP